MIYRYILSLGRTDGMDRWDGCTVGGPMCKHHVCEARSEGPRRCERADGERFKRDIVQFILRDWCGGGLLQNMCTMYI